MNASFIDSPSSSSLYESNPFQKGECALVQFPLEVIYEIFKHLDAQSIVRFSLTCHFFAAASQTEEVWKRLVRHDFIIAYSSLTSAVEKLPIDKKISTLWFKLYGLLAKGGEVWRQVHHAYHRNHFYSLSTIGNDYIIGSSDDQVRILSSPSNPNEVVLEGHEGIINCLAGMADGRIVTGSADCTVRLWSLHDKSCIILGRHEEQIEELVVLPHHQIAAASADGIVRLWSLNDCSSCILEKMKSSPLLAVLPHNRLVITDRGFTNVSIWSLDNKERSVLQLQKYPVRKMWINCLTTLADGRLAIGTGEGAIYLYNLATQTFEFLSGNLSKISCMTLLCDGRLVTGSGDGKLCLWSLKGSAHLCWQAYRGRIDDVTSFPDGRIVSQRYLEREMSIWSIDAEALCQEANKKHSLPQKKLKKRRLKK